MNERNEPTAHPTSISIGVGYAKVNARTQFFNIKLTHKDNRNFPLSLPALFPAASAAVQSDGSCVLVVLLLQVH